LRNNDQKGAADMFKKSTIETNNYCEIAGTILGGAVSNNIEPQKK
jgi:hypothetical protein